MILKGINDHSKVATINKFLKSSKKVILVPIDSWTYNLWEADYTIITKVRNIRDPHDDEVENEKKLSTKIDYNFSIRSAFFSEKIIKNYIVGDLANLVFQVFILGDDDEWIVDIDALNKLIINYNYPPFEQVNQFDPIDRENKINQNIQGYAKRIGDIKKIVNKNGKIFLQFDDKILRIVDSLLPLLCAGKEKIESKLIFPTDLDIDQYILEIFLVFSLIYYSNFKGSSFGFNVHFRCNYDDKNEHKQKSIHQSSFGEIIKYDAMLASERFKLVECECCGRLFFKNRHQATKICTSPTCKPVSKMSNKELEERGIKSNKLSNNKLRRSTLRMCERNKLSKDETNKVLIERGLAPLSKERKARSKK